MEKTWLKIKDIQPVKKEQERTTANKTRMLEALRRNGCLFHLAAKEVGINYCTHRAWMKDDEDYRNAVNDIAASVGDEVEAKLKELIDNGDTSATIFYCKTKLKYRGFTERTEITGANGEPLIPRSIDEAKRILEDE